MTAHARLSASKAHRWISCPGSVALEEPGEDTSSSFADWGTDAHELAALCLETVSNPPAYAGRIMGKGNVVDDEMIDCVQTYIDNVRTYAEGNQLFVEQQVSYAVYTGIASNDNSDDSFGTSDAIIIADGGRELQVHDLKAGRGVKVDAQDNEQMMLYALGAYESFSLACDFEHVRLVIHQPRLGALSEWDLPLADLLEWAKTLPEKAEAVQACIEMSAVDLMRQDGAFNPGDKQCRFCPAKARCPALDAKVAEVISGDFADLTAEAVQRGTDDLKHVFSLTLGRKMELVDLVEGWCKAVRARAESELLAGREVTGFKLVEGRRGHRAWRNKDEAEAELKSMRLKIEDMYDMSLISPTTAEKLAKKNVIGPRQWPRLTALIHQPEGKPSVAPATDKRPALNPSDDFADLSATTDNAAHPWGRD